MSQHYVGERLSFSDAPCTVRYVGEVDGTQGEWLGVEWDDPTRGKHAGVHGGRRYFDCMFKAAFGTVRTLQRLSLILWQVYNPYPLQHLSFDLVEKPIPREPLLKR